VQPRARLRPIRSPLLATLAVLAMAGAPARAHPVPYSYVDLHLERGAITGTVVVHIYDVAHDLKIVRPATLLTPPIAASASEAFVKAIGQRLQIIADGRALPLEWGLLSPLPERESVGLSVHAALTSVPGALTVSGPMITYESEHQTYLNIYEGGHVTQSILDQTHPQFEYFTGSRQGSWAVIKKFLPAGIHHILIGPDHLLFLVGLLLLGGSVRRLLGIITAFTVAHSITLSLAALAIVSPPARIIEPAIALSIMYVGADNLMVKEGRDYRSLIAFVFGFIHGFGFASVLHEMDLPRAALGWSLFSFNAGVEIGQMLVVVPVATAIALLRAHSETAGRRLVFAGSLVVIAASAFWFVQRVFFPEVSQ
jgi:hydrogenase/urease accessory protein HupE